MEKHMKLELKYTGLKNLSFVSAERKTLFVNLQTIWEELSIFFYKSILFYIF